MMFALNNMAVRYGLKFSLSPFLIHIKSQTEERGAGGGTATASERGSFSRSIKKLKF